MDLEKIHRDVFEIIKKASGISLKYFRKNHNPELKEDQSVITLADSEVNNFLIEELSKIDSEIGFITEETKIQNVKEYNWIIDPIDGTNNYDHGLELWGINIALWHKNEPLYGIMYFPMLIENLIYFIKDKGAFNYKNEKINYLNKDLIKTTVSFGGVLPKAEKIGVYTTVKNKGYSYQNYGAACYEIKTLADNAADCLLQLKLAIWDIAVGVGLLREMGCPLEFLYEEIPYNDERFLGYNHYFIAGKQEIIDSLKEDLKEVLNL